MYIFFQDKFIDYLSYDGQLVLIDDKAARGFLEDYENNMKEKVLLPPVDLNQSMLRQSTTVGLR